LKGSHDAQIFAGKTNAEYGVIKEPLGRKLNNRLVAQPAFRKQNRQN